MPTRHLTPKQKVLRRYPEALSWAWAGPGWVIYTKRTEGFSLNVSNSTAALAWRAAWATVKSEDQKRRKEQS
jgi:hypothetical protein